MHQEMRLRNYSERSIRTYTGLFCKVLNYYPDHRPKDLDSKHIKDYLYHRIKSDSISVSTINQTISAWRIFYVHILGKTWEGFRIQRPRREKKLPEVLSQEEARRLVNSPRNLKHRAILQLLYSTGMRRGELIALRVVDIDSCRMIITIRQGKGKKDRQVILHDKMLSLLREYYKRYRPKLYLFEGLKQGERYSAGSIQKIVKEAGKASGITKRVSVHTLRHCFATHMLEKGVNIKLIQQLLGHTSIKTTSLYLSLANFDQQALPNPLDSYE